MELVDGSSLAELLADGAPLPIDQALHIEDSILAALGAAHAAGIVHRDVKPGNVLLGDHGRVKLADFGIARRLDDLTSDLTGVGQFIGTPKYLAPEQLAGEPATPASDLYAAGVVLYEMLAGEPPFDAATPMELAWAHHNAPVPDVRVLRPDVPAPVVATIATAMAKHPGRALRHRRCDAPFPDPPGRPGRRAAGDGTARRTGAPADRRRPDDGAIDGRWATTAERSLGLGGRPRRARRARRRWRRRRLGPAGRRRRPHGDDGRTRQRRRPPRRSPRRRRLRRRRRSIRRPRLRRRSHHRRPRRRRRRLRRPRPSRRPCPGSPHPSTIC